MTDQRSYLNSAYEELVEEIRSGEDEADQGRIRQGEAACAVVKRWGALKQAALDAHVEYKTLAGRKRVVEFYGSNNSAQAEIVVGNSLARWLLSEYPVLRFTHLRVAIGLKDFEEAMSALIDAVEQSMTPQEFKRHVAQMKRANGHKPRRYIFDARAGYVVVVSKSE